MAKKKNIQSKKELRINIIVYLVLRFLVIICMVEQAMKGNWHSVALCFLTLILFTLPTIASKTFKVKLPTTLEIIVYLFIFAAEILGEIQNFYGIFKHWDTMLHTLNGFLSAAVGFSLIDILNRTERFHIKMAPSFVALVAFCFSMTIGVLWEFFEFGMDYFLGTDMQKDTVIHAIHTVSLDPTLSNKVVTIPDIQDVVINVESLGLGGYLDIGLLDTMEDLLVNFIGAAVFSFVGYFYVKNRGKGWFARNFIPQVLPDEESDGETDRPEE